MSCLFLDPDRNLPNQGFDLERQYQMVPAGGTRRMGFAMLPDEPEDVIIYCDNPNKAFLWSLYALTGKAVPQGSGYLIARNSAVRFYITGRDLGPAAIRVESVSGKMRGFLLISVKPLVGPLTYQLHILSDMKHVPDKAKAAAEMITTMQAVEPIFLKQANIQLKRVGPIKDVIVPTNLGDKLGDKLVIDKPETIKAIYEASQSISPSIAHINIFYTWNLVYTKKRDVGGSTIGNYCFIENVPPGNWTTYAYAHEIGHARGLGHSDEAYDIMFGSPNNVYPKAFSEFEIEALNPY
jgi:hypothetical protein